MKTYLAVLLLIAGLFNAPVKAQLNLYASYQGISDDNIFNNTYQISDFINSFSFGSAYNFDSEVNNVQLYYEGSLNYFHTNTSKSFNSHRLGLVETHLFSIDDNPLNAGLNISFRNNEDEFELYNFQQISAYINYRHSVSETDFILPGYVFNKNTYKNFPLFSHNEHKLFLTWISNFETRTSLSLNAELNLKQYSQVYDIEGYLNEATQVKLLMNVGQALGDQTGMNGYVVVRKNLSDGSRYLIDPADTSIYYEEEIFNDIYSYDGIETGVGIKHYFTQSIELSLEAKYMIRNYSSLPAVGDNDIELTEMREDKQFGLGAGLLFDLSSVIKGLSLSAVWNYFKNNSNDYYYEFSNQIISGSLDYNF